ncbi:MAG TPA: glycosyltransferase family 4 protein [Thermoanaerobaculia bacterium]|nr:glycosyltransferase family 4 protein [Thermoanaerobaculia bacterium]
MLLPQGYNSALIEEAKQSVIRGTPVSAVDRYMNVCRKLASGLVATMERHAVRVLVIENGTLPDNPLFTEAIYLAVDEYGERHGLDRYVLWRDHDLMWSTEPHVYGSFPYPGVRRPKPNKYIHYCVATEWMQRRFEAWARDVPCHVIPNRFHVPAPDLASRRDPTLRQTYGVPEDALLIARCTRVIPQKTIVRDLRLVQVLQRRLAEAGDHRRIYLFVTGPTGEDPAEFRRLRELSVALSVDSQVIWGNGLLPFNSVLGASMPDADRFSVRDLLAEADLSSFLTSYDYEGFGNPPGEAMAFGLPFIVTSYELYDEVYGRKGTVAPVLSIKRDSQPDAPIPDSFLSWVMRALTDREYRERAIVRNQAICKRYFSLDALAEQVQELFNR